jgi:hypothetical protein
VRLTPETPDFFLGVTPPADHRPDGATILQGGSQSLTVFATRRDGFAGEIRLSVEGLPAGVSCPAQSIAAGARQTQLVLTAAADAPATVAGIRVKGKAMISGRRVEHEARPAGVVWPPMQAGQVQPLLTRLDRSLVLAVRPGAPYALVPTLEKPAVLQGGKADLKLKVTRLWPDAKAPLSVQGLAADLVPGLTLNNNQPVTIAADKSDGSIPVAIGAGVAPGKYNLVLRTSGNIPFNKDPAAKQKQPINVVQPSAPVMLTVLPKTVGTLAVANSTPAAKAGSRVEVQVRVARLFEYDGDFKVQLVVPANVKGLSADEVTIPAGRDEAKLVLRIAADAPPGNLSNLIVRATAVLEGNLPVLQETKLGLNILKP